MLRIASSQLHTTMTAALGRAQTRVQDTLTKMAEGKRFLLPSEDPVSTVRLMRLGRESAALEQYETNIKALRTRLNVNEAKLGSIVDDLTQAHDLVIWSANGGNTPADVNSIAIPLAALRDGILATANERDEEGRYLFSGTATNSPTISYDATQPLGSRYTWTGNTVKQKVGVGNGVTSDANVTLESLAATLNLMDTSAATLASPTVNPSDPAVAAQVRTTLDSLDAALTNISSKVGALGSEQNVLETLLSGHQNVQLSNDQAYLALGQLDYGDAVAKLNGYSTGLEAAQKAYGKVNSLSLFDVI